MLNKNFNSKYRGCLKAHFVNITNEIGVFFVNFSNP